MKEATGLYKKKKYISWFLGNHKLKKPEAAKILEFIMENEEILARVRFVENVRRLPSALVISSLDASTAALFCRINDIYYEHIDDIIYVLSSNPPEDLFVWLSFNREFMCSMCESILEIKPEIRNKIFYYQVVRNLEEELFKKFRERDKHREELLRQIDDALKNKNRELFYQLTNMYRQLMNY